MVAAAAGVSCFLKRTRQVGHKKQDGARRPRDNGPASGVIFWDEKNIQVAMKQGSVSTPAMSRVRTRRRQKLSTRTARNR